MLTALKETEQALARYAASLDQNAALARASQAADDAAKLARIRFDTGRDSFLNLLVAEQNRAAARQALAQSDTGVADAQVSLVQGAGRRLGKCPAGGQQPAAAIGQLGAGCFAAQQLAYA